MSDWSPPEVGVGDTVLYYPHAGADPVMAFVIKVGHRALTLWALAAGYGGVEKPSVRHKEDPNLGDSPEWSKFGVWAERPRDPRLAILSERVSALEASNRGNKK
jgi:hypothetical protein